MSLKVDAATGSAYWASYLINGDSSGLEPGEVELCDAWQARIAPAYVVCTQGESYFSWAYGAITGDSCAGGELLEYVTHESAS